MRNWLASLAQPARFARTQQTIHFHKLSRILCEPLKLSSGGPLTFSTRGPLPYHRVKLQALISRFQKFKNLWSVLCGPLKLVSGGPLTFSTPGPPPYHQVKLQALISRFQKLKKSASFVAQVLITDKQNDKSAYRLGLGSSRRVG